MPDAQRLSSLRNPRIKAVMRYRKSRDRRREGVLIAEGRREIERALATGLTPREAFVCPELWADPLPLPATAVERAVFTRLAYHARPDGLLAVFEAPRWSLDRLAPPPPDGLYLVAVGTEKPGNLGAMVRTAAAAGCAAVLAVGPIVDAFNPNAIRNSTAAVFELPTVSVEDADEAVGWLKGHGVRIAAAVAENGRCCFEADLPRPLALVVGPEHAGLSAAWRAAADVALCIPMAGGGVVDSLNASNAAAVLLFEAVRQSARRT